MKNDIVVTLIGVILAGPVMFVWHILKGFKAGFQEFLSLQKEFWSLILEDFK